MIVPESSCNEGPWQDGETRAPLPLSRSTATHVILSEGIDLPKAEDAKLEASRRVGDLLEEHASKGRSRLTDGCYE